MSNSVKIEILKQVLGEDAVKVEALPKGMTLNEVYDKFIKDYVEPNNIEPRPYRQKALLLVFFFFGFFGGRFRIRGWLIGGKVLFSLLQFLFCAGKKLYGRVCIQKVLIGD